MDTIAEQIRADEERLPADIDAQPVVQAAAALKPALRQHREEIEREQRLPPVLVEQMRAAGFYRMVLPRSLGGLQVDPLTYTRVVEHLAEGCGSVGWNLANNSIGQPASVVRPVEGGQDVCPSGHKTCMPGAAVPGGAGAVPVEGVIGGTGRC